MEEPAWSPSQTRAEGAMAEPTWPPSQADPSDAAGRALLMDLMEWWALQHVDWVSVALALEWGVPSVGRCCTGSGDCRSG